MASAAIAVGVVGISVLAGCAASSPETAGYVSPKVEAPTTVAARRMTESQYRNTIADLYGSDIELSGRFEPDQREGGLLAIGSAPLSISSGGFEQYMSMARAVTDQALDEKRRDKFAPCKPADLKAADDKCVEAFVRTQGRLLFRRPLTDQEVATRVKLANNGATVSKDYYAGLKLAFASLLSAPEFLFRIELAEANPDKPQEARLDAYSKAQRLAFLLTDSAPDEELLKAAESGAIHTPEGLQAQVDRLVASPRLEKGVRAFFADMLQLELFESVTKDAATYPKYSLAVANSAKEQTLKTLVDHLLVKKGDYREIFTTRDTFIDRSLASVYDLPFLGAGGWAAYKHPEDADNAGILTQVTFLSLFSHPNTSSPTKRGVALNEIFLCEPTPLPPGDVDFSVFQESEGGSTVRERLLAHATREDCAGCHNLSDPLGLSLERYDAIGQTRLMENGKPIDVSAKLDGKDFVGAKGLGMLMREHPKVPRCLVRNVYAYGVGRNPDETEWEDAYLTAQTKAFEESGYQVPAAMRGIAASPEFYRVVFAPAPKPAEPETKIADQAPTRLAGELQ